MDFCIVFEIIYGLRSLIPVNNIQFTYWETNNYNLTLKECTET